ncbi:MAG: sigma 54-interacting transcriptional regulator [Firmicutes bacterium]|nr:sigma 54-interacting transcriptional regulator [Bacillota bacterium]
MTFSENYKKILKEKWHAYIEQDSPMPDSDPKIRDFIYESWKRSKAHGVTPLEVKNKQLSQQDLTQLLSTNQKLIKIAHPYLQNIYSFIKGSNFVLALTDASGYVIDLLGDDTMIKTRTNESGLEIGCCRSEEYAGTNGIGTCLIVGKPIQIWSYEHYIRPHHDYICSAAPIRDANEKIIGCLDVVGPVSMPHNHTLAMVSASVDGIRKEFIMQESYEKLTFANNQMSSTIEVIDSGIIMFDNLGIILQYNKRACQILNLTEKHLKKSNLANIIDINNSTINPFQPLQNMQNQEVTLAVCTGEKIHVSLSLSIIKNAQEQKRGTVLVINELKKIHKMVNRISGFTATYTFDSIMGQSPAINAAKDIAKAAAQSSSNVLILGESGTGKELMAQAIHNASARASGPFIAINCGSLPKSLIESELFGYERGAFTGANKEGNPGKFELANGGTIFLDEIGDMPLELQASLLRVIQSREIVRIGGKQSKPIDVRIMAATNVNLLESVQKKEFRGDLYYRLNVLSIEIPPLRKRKSDITLLIDHFITSISHILKKEISHIEADAIQILQDYNWPGNVRELENTIERAVNMAIGNTITIADLPSAITNAIPGKDLHSTVLEMPAVHARPALPETGSEVFGNRSYNLIVSALSAEGGNVSKAAERLGISRRTLYRKIEKYEINVDNFRLI